MQSVAHGQSLAEARSSFRTNIVRHIRAEYPTTPPPELFDLVKYNSPAGALDAYVSPDPGDESKHPAIVWIFGSRLARYPMQAGSLRYVAPSTLNLFFDIGIWAFDFLQPDPLSAFGSPLSTASTLHEFVAQQACGWSRMSGRVEVLGRRDFSEMKSEA